jgi:putative oxygen-independent coproporphyrinogen III oxidase
LTTADVAGSAVEASAPGLYLHVPFCSAICPYCDFAVVRDAAGRREGFVASLQRELLWWGRRDFPGGAFDTVYLGGGTPSALEGGQLERVLAALRQHLPVADDAWLTLEANPEDVTIESVARWRAVGVGTLSLGVQSFDDAALRFLGRRHDGDAARRSVAVALAAGFPIVSVDLIYGLPTQTASAWRRDLASAAELAPQHLSCYQLTVHAGTPFALQRERGRLRELAEPAQAQLFRLTHEELAARGYAAYEVSNFARSPEHRSRHNRKYWRHAPYLGLGPSAHSFDGGARWWNERGLAGWEAALAGGEAPIAGREQIGAPELALEHLLLGLRSADGVDLRRMAALGHPLAEHPLLPALIDEGKVRLAQDRLYATLAGWSVADGLAAALARPAAAPPGAPPTTGVARFAGAAPG